MINNWQDVKDIEDLGKLEDNSQTAENMADLINALKEREVVITEEQVETILAKVQNDQIASYMADLVNALKKSNPNLKFEGNYVETILAKVGEQQYAFSMINLVKALTESKVDITKHVETILAKVKNNGLASDMEKLVKALTESKVVITGNHVGTILEKLEEEQSASYMVKLVNELKKSNPNLEFDENQVNTILAKVKNTGFASDMVELVTALKESGVVITEKQVEKILAKVGEELNASKMVELVNELKKSNPNLKFNKNQVQTILEKVGENTDVVPMIKLAIELKNSNPELNFNEINNVCDWIKSLDGVFTKGYKNIDKNIINGENNKDIKGEQNKKVLAKAIISYFKYELQNLKQHPDQIDSQKEVWFQIADDLETEEILTELDQLLIKDKVNDIHDLNRLATFVQWLGCVLSALFLLPLAFAPVRNRIIHPENTRKLERFRDKKDELIAPLQGFVNPQQEGDYEIK
ncbi:MAG: hypothetical protein IJU86_03675 [Firmicutes bacterium]|nr:hypothetical protein [Bacillota bacterium]